MPLAMPARLATIDMTPVYDGFREGFTMRMKLWGAVLLIGLEIGAANAQTPAHNQPQPASVAPMSGMDVSMGEG
jgi:hypothetical protein